MVKIFREADKAPVAVTDFDGSAETTLLEPCNPGQNGLGESFNGTFRDERLRVEWLRNRTDAEIMIESWRRL